MDYKFKTDGCSGLVMGLIRWYWKVRYKQLPPWEVDCVKHDGKYWKGGTTLQRVKADTKLAEAVASCGYPVLGRMMFIGVSVGGHPLLPLPWRWGYGWKYPRGYE